MRPTTLEHIVPSHPPAPHADYANPPCAQVNLGLMLIVCAMWPFGLLGRRKERQADPHSVADAVDLDCGIQIRGSIDLVEHHPSGFVRVTDHKTGKADGKTEQLVDGGKSLRPLLCALEPDRVVGFLAGSGGA